jgi:hypothetical protein
LVIALVLYRWIGVLGLLLAAPVLASGQLVTRYVTLKMLDQDPWPDEEQEAVPLAKMLLDLARSVWGRLKNVVSRIKLPTTNKNNGKEAEEDE